MFVALYFGNETRGYESSNYICTNSTMSAAGFETYADPKLAELRLLTEVEHFIEHMDEFGNVPDDIFDAVALNRKTSVAEIAMPYAVTTTTHEVVERESESGKRERVIVWLGRTALENASNGHLFHFSEAAHRRTFVEETEAIYNQDTLRPGIAQSMISPKMTRYDASEALAKAEHLFEDDAVRTSTAITDSQGEVIGRKLQSLLVRHVPFEAWTKMMKDPGNVFGKAFVLRDELSAVSVMELFDQIDMPEDKLPEGPVTLVEAVLPYIDDELTRQKVRQQLTRYRGDQELYDREAIAAGKEWALFDLELARSLREGLARDALRFMIMQNAHAWDEQSLRVIDSCQLGDTQYAMTSELAALLARAKQKLVGDELSVVAQNDEAIQAVSAEVASEIKTVHAQLVAARNADADPAYIYSLQQRQYDLLHQQPIRSGGGCSGGAASAFGSRGSTSNLETGLETGVGENESPFKATAESKAGWKWKQGVCQVKTCPSPKPTEVGPCSVCRRCQHQFDIGLDPTKSVVPPKPSQQIGKVSVLGARRKSSKKASPSAKIPIAA